VTDKPDLKAEVDGLNLIVSGGGFCAVYYKSTDQPQLMLRLRTKTDDYELLARAWITANKEGPRAGMDCVSLDAQLIHTATISTRRPSANKARIMKLALISMVGLLLCLLNQFQRGFATAPFEFYWARCGVVGTTCSGTVAFAHTPALPGSDELQSRPDLHNGPFLLSQTSPRPTAGFSGFSAANAFKAPNAKSKSPDRR
jgi:hypothetical protein